MFDDFSIPEDRLRIKLPPGVHEFEPVSGIMVLNVTDQEFEDMRDSILGGSEEPHWLAEPFYHEMHHCFQTYCTGFLFKHVCSMAQTLGTEFDPPVWPIIQAYLVTKLLRWFTALLPRATRDRIRASYHVQTSSTAYADLEERSQETGQSRVVASFVPELYKKLAELKNQTLRAGKDGISANDVLEGGAAVWASLKTHDYVATTAQLFERLSGLEPTYTRSLNLARELCGDRTARVFLPATALALRYEVPENAFGSLVRLIASAALGGELAEAKKLGAALPPIAEAGSVLGTAVEARAKLRARFRVYEKQMTALKTRSWRIDELDLLTNAGATEAIPLGLLGFGLMTKTSSRGFNDSPGRQVIAAIMLRGGLSVPQQLREIQESLPQSASESVSSAADSYSSGPS
jgi:hypothetical protein